MNSVLSLRPLPELLGSRPVLEPVSDSLVPVEVTTPSSNDSTEEASKTTELVLSSTEFDSDIVKFIFSNAKRFRSFGRKILPVEMHGLSGDDQLKLTSGSKLNRDEICQLFYKAYDEFEKQVISVTDSDLWEKSVAFIKGQLEFQGESVDAKLNHKCREIALVGEKADVASIKSYLASESGIWRRELAQERETVTEVVSYNTIKHLGLLQTFHEFDQIRRTVEVKFNDQLQHIVLQGHRIDVFKAKDAVRQLMDNILEESISLQVGLWKYFHEGPGVKKLEGCFKNQKLLSFVVEVESSHPSIRIASVKKDMTSAKELLRKQFAAREVSPPDKKAKAFFCSSESLLFFDSSPSSKLVTLVGFGQSDAEKFFVVGHRSDIEQACDVLQTKISDRTDKEELLVVNDSLIMDLLDRHCRGYLSDIAENLQSKFNARITIVKGTSQAGILVKASAAGLKDCVSKVQDFLKKIVIEDDTVKSHGIDSYTLGRNFRSEKREIEEECGVVINVVRDNASKSGLTKSSCPLGEYVWRKDSPKKVYLYAGDVSCHKTDAVVNAANEEMTYDRGLAKVLGELAGEQLLDESKAVLLKVGRLKTGEAVATTAGALKTAKAIIHAVAPTWKKNARNEEEKNLSALLHSATFKSLCAANDKKFSTIAFPALGAGVSAFPPSVVAQSMISAVDTFFQKFPQPSLTQVDFVMLEKDSENIGHFGTVLKQKFLPLWVAAPPSGSSLPQSSLPGSTSGKQSFRSTKVIVKQGDITAEKVRIGAKSANLNSFLENNYFRLALL